MVLNFCTGANVTIIADRDEFLGLYFDTPQMLQDVQNFPEIIFVDGTYKLFKRNFTLMLMVVENNHGETLVGGVGILANEKRQTLNKFFQCFKDSNIDSFEKILCFMTDKDLTERSVIESLFPGKKLYLCQFHVKKALNRAVETGKMKINAKEKELSLQYLNSLVESKSEGEYNKIYGKFVQAAPAEVVQYFDEYWHLSRSEWTAYSMVNGNLGNLTNNRLESLNRQIKKDMRLHNTLVEFIRSFFDNFLKLRSREFQTRRILEMQKKNVKQFPQHSDEVKFETAMTKYGFNLILKEIKLSKTITFLTSDDKNKLCTIAYKKAVIIQVSLDKCSCFEITSLLLPACRHIFAVRRKYGFSLFDESYKNNRWMDRKCVDLPDALEQCADAAYPLANRPHVPKKTSSEEKHFRLSLVLDEILNFGVNKSSEEEYQQLLADLNSFLIRHRDKVNSLNDNQVDNVDIKEMEENMGNLSISLCEQSTDLFNHEEDPAPLQNESIREMKLPPKLDKKRSFKKNRIMHH